jgi:hypothetical protein
VSERALRVLKAMLSVVLPARNEATVAVARTEIPLSRPLAKTPKSAISAGLSASNIVLHFNLSR